MTETKSIYRQGEAALHIRTQWCKGCRLCVEACPKEILALDALDRVYVTDIAKCIFCGLCAERCPDFCISLERSLLSARTGRVQLEAKETA